jgi:SWI/SNF-related matrix-associated actin-dependent regulator 1 of chromatin subfamily A
VQLDYVPATQRFVLWADRSDPHPHTLMHEHGLDFSRAASSPGRACLFTSENYAAAAFWDKATPLARAQLAPLHAEIERSWASTSNAHIKCPPDQELFPFQKAGVEYALKRKNTLIGDQPGLGKTAQAICYANEIGAKRVLVICPAAIRLQWVKQIRTWTTMRWPFTVYPILSGKHGVHPDAHWTVCSFDLARSAPIWRALAPLSFDLLIIDEGHYLKSVDALRTRAVFGGGDAPVAVPLASRAGAILDLTGTPLPNRLREAYTACRGLNFEAIDFMSEAAFKDRFNPSAQFENAAGQLVIKEASGRHGELQARLRGNFMVRRLKKDVQPQMKMPLLEIVHVEETGEVRRALQAERLLDIDPTDLEGINSEILGEIATVRRMMGIAVAPLAAEYVDMLLQGGEEKVFLVGYHTQVLDILEAKLERYHPLRIDGSTSPSRRQKAVEQFGKPGTRLLIGQILAVGTGTDGLQNHCSRGVAAEPDWVSGVNEQVINRIDRMGQAEQVLFSFLVAPNSFGERVLGTSLQKAKEVDKALDRRLA